jgi:7-carboxy-7-deazaguanine synthase
MKAPGPLLFMVSGWAAMAFQDLLVTEIFHSLQGETSLSGRRFAFIRLTGCNLRCSYCDTTYAFKGGRRMTVEQVIASIEAYDTRDVLITGGEPLIQRRTPELVQALVERGYRVSIETHGEAPIHPVATSARIVMDVKTPSSGMCRGGFERNLPHLKQTDEVKFVIASPEDYAWARDLVLSRRIPTEEILFSPATRVSSSPGSYPGVQPAWLAERILEDRLPVRLQLQLHKLLWGADRRGV